MDWDKLLFNVAVFTAGVFLLEYGADKFIDHAAIVGQRLGVSQTLIALLTAGAEYEELAVVIAAVLQKQSPLALGNVMGSTISNILGAFSLGLLFHPGRITFDYSAKVYTALCLVITTVFSILAYMDKLDKIAGGTLLALFTLYMLSIFFAIHRGVVSPPEAPDSDSDSDSNSDGYASDEEASLPPQPRSNPRSSETSPLLRSQVVAPTSADRNTKRARPLLYHIAHLLLGFVVLTICGYLLSHSASTIAECLNLSGTVIGFTVVSFATTLPEKMIALISGSRGHSGIMVAAAAGSNIFLLTLCAGVIALPGGLDDQDDHPLLFEIVLTWVSAVLLFGVVFLGGIRIVGLLFLVMYLAFLVLEFTVFRR